MVQGQGTATPYARGKMVLECWELGRVQTPLYSNAVKKQMDLKTILRKLEGRNYCNIFGLNKHMKLICFNVEKFTSLSSDIFKAAEEMDGIWSHSFEDIKKDPIAMGKKDLPIRA